MRIQIQAEDREILETISNLLRYTGPMYEVPPPKKFPHRKPQVCLCINRKSLADKLVDLGCKPNKSLILLFPDEQVVPDHLLNHFVRGCFDGDGGFRLAKNKYLQAHLTSTKEFLLGLAERVLDPLNIPYNMYQRHDDTNSYSLHISRQAEAKKFRDWLYKDATLFLTRKKPEELL
jgi:hypothetical protein